MKVIKGFDPTAQWIVYTAADCVAFCNDFVDQCRFRDDVDHDLLVSVLRNSGKLMVNDDLFV